VPGDAILLVIGLTASGVVLGVFGIGAFLMVRDSIRRRGNWGLNFKPVHCPSCGAPAPEVRRTNNRRQMLWGGCTCAECGREYDKWGVPVEEDESRS
jgi:hypothetical protein